VRAATLTSDQSDLWFNPGESGWGIQLVQQGSLIFATMFVYDASKNPVWYSALLANANATTWSGDLNLTSGPWFGGAFTPPVSGRRVGAMSWQNTSDMADAGLLSYAVDGVNVTKTIQRQTLVTQDYSGRFGGLLSVTDPCHAIPTFEDYADVNVVQSGTSAQVGYTNAATNVTCTTTGVLTQTGQFANVIGSMQCNNGTRGTSRLSEMRISRDSIAVRFHFDLETGCVAEGYFGGMRYRK